MFTRSQNYVCYWAHCCANKREIKMSVKGLNHITIAVKNLDKAFEFYRTVLEFKPLMKSSRSAYFLTGDLWFCLDLDSATRKEPLPEYTHFAFSVEQNDFKKVSQKILTSGCKTWKENKSEGDSIYFLDPDGHKLEIHVGNWKSRIESIKSNPWEKGIQFFE